MNTNEIISVQEFEIDYDDLHNGVKRITIAWELYDRQTDDYRKREYMEYHDGHIDVTWC